MRRHAAVALLAALLALPPPGSAATFAGPPHVTQTALANGLRVVVVENHALPLVQVAVWYRFGSANDPPGRQGLAHALEHMMFRGTRALSGPGLDLVGAQLGSETNAETDYEYTHYHQTVPVDGLAVALHIEADRMRGLLLRSRDWNVERRAVLVELAEYESADVGALESAVRRAAFGSSPFAHDPVGTGRDLERTSAADLRRAYDAAYQPDNATLVITGDVQPAAVVRLARSLFGPMRGHAHVRYLRSESPMRRGFTVRRQALNENVVDVALGSSGLLRGGPGDEVALELLQPSHAALRDLIVDAGPCSSYQVDDDSQLYGGLLHLVCRLNRGVAPADAVRSIRRALQRLAAHVPAGAIAYARRADLAAGAAARDSLAAEADLYGESIALQRTDPRQFERDAARVPDAAVAAALRRLVTPVGVGIATGAVPRYSFREEPVRRPRGEHVPASTRTDAVVEPDWARIPATALHSPDSSADVFALANGLRVFVDRRPGSGRVYVRAGFDRHTYLRDSAAWTKRRIARVAEKHALTVDIAPESTMQGSARDLATMLRILSGAWQAPPDAIARALGASRAPRPEHAWIALTGDVDPRAVRAQVERSLGAWRVQGEAATPAPSPRTSSMPKPGVFTFGTAAPGVRAFLLGRAPYRDDPDFAAMMILNAILGQDGDFDTRLMRDVRARRGLVYGVGSEYDAHRGALFLYFDSTSPDFASARAAVRGVVDGLRTGPISPAEFERARRKLLAKALRDQASPDGVLEVLSSAARERRPPDDIDALAVRYGAVTLADVERAARAHLRPASMIEFVQGGPR